MLAIDIIVNGLAWPLLYWLAVSIVGVWLSINSLRHALAEVRTTRADEKPLRTSALGYLVIHVLLSVCSGVLLLVDVTLILAGLTTGLNLEFSSRMGQYLFIGGVLAVPSGAALTAVLFWLGRWRTLRALDGE